MENWTVKLFISLIYARNSIVGFGPATIASVVAFTIFTSVNTPFQSSAIYANIYSVAGSNPVQVKLSTPPVALAGHTLESADNK